MDVEMVYTEGPCRIVVGYSDDKQEHYGWIESDAIEPEVLWAYQVPSGFSHHNVLDMLTHTQRAARRLIGIEHFELDAYDMDQLTRAPQSRQVDSTELIPIDALDTDYLAGFTQFEMAIDDALPELEDVELETADCMALLRDCVETLSQLQRIEIGEEENLLNNHVSIEVQKTNAVAVAALELVSNSYELATSMNIDSRPILEVIALRLEPWNISDLFNGEEIIQIDSFTQNLCGSRLTQFPQAVERGYDPTTGLPINCRNPETFSYETVVLPGTEVFYEHFGLSHEEALRVADIQRTDPRYRAEEDWDYIEAMTLRMKAFAEQSQGYGN